MAFKNEDILSNEEIIKLKIIKLNILIKKYIKKNNSSF